MASYLSILALLALCVAYAQCQVGRQEAKVGERVEIPFGVGDIEKTVGSKKYTFHFSGPNKGSFTDPSGKKVGASNLQIQGKNLIITKATKADAGFYSSGPFGLHLSIL